MKAETLKHHVDSVQYGESVYGYQPVVLKTSRGNIRARYYKAENATSAAVWMTSVGANWGTPANALFPAMAHRLMRHQISSLWIECRQSNVLEDEVFDLLCVIDFLVEKEHINRLALIGHSMAGTAVIDAASASTHVETVVALSPQAHGGERVFELSPRCSILFIHGDEDQVVPQTSAMHLYHLAGQPKQLLIFEGNHHALEESAEKVHQVVYAWVRSELSEESSD